MKSGSLSAGWWYLIRVHSFKLKLPMCVLASSGPRNGTFDWTAGTERIFSCILKGLRLRAVETNRSNSFSIILQTKSERMLGRPWDCPSAEDLISVLRSRTWILKNAMFQSPRAESHVNESERRRALSVRSARVTYRYRRTPLGCNNQKAYKSRGTTAWIHISSNFQIPKTSMTSHMRSLSSTFLRALLLLVRSGALPRILIGQADPLQATMIGSWWRPWLQPRVTYYYWWWIWRDGMIQYSLYVGGLGR